MNIIKTPLNGLFVIEPIVFKDSRGYFFECFHKEKMKFLPEFVQDNESLSQKGVLRGLHFQLPPFTQAKLCRVVKGAVLDVAVDIRKNSSTYGKHFSIELNEENKLMLFIPEGFAHGFHTLRNDTVFLYKCSNFYNKLSEVSILWNDPDIGIEWKEENPILSDKDKNGIPLKEFHSPF